MEELFGTVDSIVFAEEENGFAIARIKEQKKKEPTTILGPMPGLQVGETIRCKGVWKMHPKHGQQFEVASFETQMPSDVVGIQRFLESGFIKGIGPAYAGRIVKKFGAETLKILEEKPEKLLGVQGIGEKRLEIIIRCWGEQKSVRDVMLFLRGNGVTPSYAQKIYKAYGDESIVKMRENPYRIAQDIFGIGFKTADQIAQNLGMPKEAPQRIASGLQHVMWHLSSEGHVCYPKEELFQIAEKMLEVSEEKIEKEMGALLQQEVLVEERGFVWIKPLYLCEVGIAKELKRLMQVACALRNVDEPKAVEWVEEKLRIQFAEQQKQAVSMAMREKVMILTGGPGTGKSTITNGILKITGKLTNKILLAAPTGRAAKRLSEITYKKAFTIHALLEFDFTTGGFKKGKDNPLSCDLLIVDEASMIDTQLMYALLKAVPNTARLVFVGDIDQLPSVGPGNVLRDIIDSKQVPLVRLDEIFRQAKGSDIITSAHKVNRGEFPYLKGERDFIFIEKNTSEKVQRCVVETVQKELQRFKEVQVLCPMKRGPIGTESLNQLLQTTLNPSDEPLMRMGKRFQLGDKVMQIRNNYEREVFNGDVGVIQTIDQEEQTVVVLFDGREVLYEFTELDELILAYAVSVHKYQGSECPCVIIPMHTSHFKLLHRNLLYTAITRGKKKVILIGEKRAIGMAVSTQEVQKRHTGLTYSLTHVCGSKMDHFAGSC